MVSPRFATEERKQRARERAKVWYWKNRDRSLAAHGRWYEKNSDIAKARTLKWRKDNPKRVREQDAKKRANRSKEYMAKRALYEHTRRARKRNAFGTLSVGLADRLYRLQKGCCVSCRATLHRKFEMDHIVSLAAGGLNSDANIQLLCRPCNRSKHSKDPIEFMRGRGFLL